MSTLRAGERRRGDGADVKGEDARTTADIPTSRGMPASAAGATETETAREEEDGTTTEATEEDDTRRIPTTADNDWSWMTPACPAASAWT